MPPFYRNWNIMLFLKILQKHRVTLEDIQPSTMGMSSYCHGTGLGFKFIVKTLNLIFYLFIAATGHFESKWCMQWKTTWRTTASHPKPRRFVRWILPVASFCEHEQLTLVISWALAWSARQAVCLSSAIQCRPSHWVKEDISRQSLIRLSVWTLHRLLSWEGTIHITSIPIMR